MDTDGPAQLAERVAMARAVATALLATLLLPAGATAQTTDACRFICGLEWKFEPTFTYDDREWIFESVLALDLETTVPRVGFTVEAIASPFRDDNEVELEFETNFHWLTAAMSSGWVTSHVDVVDQFSPADRLLDRRAYTHKLDFELDTAFHVFNGLPEGRWLRGVELETSLDYLARGGRSFSLVVIIPIAPF